PEKDAVSFFRETDGLAGEEFNYLAYAKGLDGRLYFGGLEGITVFHPDSIRDVQSQIIPIHVSAFLEWDPEAGMIVDRTLRLREEGRIVLKPPIQSFQLSFTPLGYQSPQNYQYAYWVEGLEPGWTFLDQPTLQLARIPPGEYILHVNGRGENGQWSASELRIP
ncbi:triple tyrosine motif-containing protein, partial [Arthrospira platensis SPKY1]|nr:triple tyrosine motif-containing protein [Arthrospira platensis SPKY1]